MKIIDIIMAYAIVCVVLMLGVAVVDWLFNDREEK